MRLAKPVLIVSTPIGVAGGLYEAWRLAGGLVFLMAMLLAVVTAAIASVVVVARREQRAEAARTAAALGWAAGDAG
jgi:hypothetical protein